MKPEDIAPLFAEVAETFPAIVGQPTDADLHELREALFPILLDIPYDKEVGAHNLVGLITGDADYTADYGARFVRPSRLPAYDSTIKDDATGVVRAEGEAIHNAKIADHALYEVAERETRKFLTAKVEDTWIRELRHHKTFYTKVHAKTILDHLQASCLGKHAVDALSLQLEMKDYHLQSEDVFEYINMLEDAQRRALRIDESNPITDQSVLNIATNAMLSTQQFPKTTSDYEDLPPTQKNWPTWKTMYKAAQGKERVRAKAAGGKDSFGGSNAGSANAATNNTPTGGSGADDNTAFTVDDLEACFDNLANAAKSERTTINELTKSNAVLTATNAELVAANKKLDNEKNQLQQEVNALRKRDGAPRNDSRRRRGKKCDHCGDNHPSDKCMELPQNASKRGADWKSKL